MAGTIDATNQYFSGKSVVGLSIDSLLCLIKIFNYLHCFKNWDLGFRFGSIIRILVSAFYDFKSNLDLYFLDLIDR
jgi:hypothetical protein